MSQCDAAELSWSTKERSLAGCGTSDETIGVTSSTCCRRVCPVNGGLCLSLGNQLEAHYVVSRFIQSPVSLLPNCISLGIQDVRVNNYSSMPTSVLSIMALHPRVCSRVLWHRTMTKRQTRICILDGSTYQQREKSTLVILGSRLLDVFLIYALHPYTVAGCFILEHISSILLWLELPPHQ